MKAVLTAALAALALGAPLTVAAQKPADSPYDRDAEWLRQPTADDMHSAMPMAAIREGLDGRVVLRCVVTVQGALRSCVVASESPAGKGFGGAALTLTTRFVLRPAMKDNKPVESMVSIPISFNSEGQRPTDSFIKGRPTTGGVIVLGNPPWQRVPTFDEVAAAYPQKAKAAGRTGRATVKCTFKKGGMLTNCGAVTEEPTGMGFGQAARTLAQTYFQSNPTWQKQGANGGPPAATDIAGVVTNIPFTFNEDLMNNAKQPLRRVTWIQTPAPPVLMAAFPAQAKAANIAKSSVTLACTVGPEGGLAGCSVASEDPKGYGFGEAALGVSRYFRVRRWTDEGLPTVGEPIRVPIRYDGMAPEAPAQASPAGG